MTRPEVLVSVDPQSCCGSGRCADALPDVFGQDEDGTVVLLAARHPSASLDDLETSADLCPCAAITVTVQAP